MNGYLFRHVGFEDDVVSCFYSKNSSRTNTSCALRSSSPIWTHLIAMPTSRLCEKGATHIITDCLVNGGLKHA